MTPPSLPENFEELEETEQTAAEEVYHRRLVHYHYVKNMEEYNKPHYDTLTDPCACSAAAFNHAGNPWEGKTRAEGCTHTTNGGVGDAYGERRAVSSRVRR